MGAVVEVLLSNLVLRGICWRREEWIASSLQGTCR